VPVVLGEHVGHRAQPVRVVGEAPVQLRGLKASASARARQVSDAQEGVTSSEVDALARRSERANALWPLQ
jgi:hypothetical protein